MALSMMVATGFFVTPQITAHAAAAAFPRSFHEKVDGTTYTWIEQTRSYKDLKKKRLDTGKWLVKKGNATLGSIEVGVNEFTTASRQHGFAIDTTTSISGLGIPHEIIVGDFPGLPDAMNSESPYGFGDISYKPHGQYVAKIGGFTHGRWHEDVTKSPYIGSHMVKNMDHLLALQDDANAKLENIYRTGSKIHHALTPAVLPIPVAALVLTAAGLVLGVGGGLVNQVCNAGHCGKHSKTWAMIGGIVGVLGTLCTIVSGASVTGWVIASRQALPAATEAVTAIAQATNVVEAGAVAASAPAAGTIPAAVRSAFPLPVIVG